MKNDTKTKSKKVKKPVNRQILYFAYGANLNLDGMSHRCPGHRPIAPAILPNYRFAFKGVADVEPMPDEKVYGALYLLRPKHIISLDRFEGYPRLYIKKQVLVRILDGLEPDNWTLATVYVMRERDNYGEPSSSYLHTILTGCKQWELPEEYQEEILRRAYHPEIITKDEIFSIKQ